MTMQCFCCCCCINKTVNITSPPHTIDRKQKRKCISISTCLSGSPLLSSLSLYLSENKGDFYQKSCTTFSVQCNQDGDDDDDDMAMWLHSTLQNIKNAGCNWHCSALTGLLLLAIQHFNFSWKEEKAVNVSECNGTLVSGDDGKCAYATRFWFFRLLFSSFRFPGLSSQAVE